MSCTPFDVNRVCFVSRVTRRPPPRNCSDAVTSCGRAVAWWTPRRRSCRRWTRSRSRPTRWPRDSATTATVVGRSKNCSRSNSRTATVTRKTRSSSSTASRAAWPRARPAPGGCRPNAIPSTCRNPTLRCSRPPLDRRRGYAPYSFRSLCTTRKKCIAMFCPFFFPPSKTSHTRVHILPSNSPRPRYILFV